MRRLCISLTCYLALTMLCACNGTGLTFQRRLSLSEAVPYEKGSNAQIDNIIDTLETDLEELRGTTSQAYYLASLRKGEDFLNAQSRIRQQMSTQISHDSHISHFMDGPLDTMVAYEYRNNDDESRSVGVIAHTNEAEMLVIYATSNERKQAATR